MVTLPDAARAYIAEGRCPFPVRNKKPVIPAWREHETTPPTEDEIRRWWGGSSPADIAIPTVGLCVVDVDAEHPVEVFDALMERLRVEDVPRTRIVRTPRGGLHVYFRAPRPVRNSSGKLAPSVDVRADGGYVVAPPSPGYELICDAPVADAPEALLLAAEARRREIPRLDAREADEALRADFPGFDEDLLLAACAVASAPIGRRNDELNRQSFVQARRKDVVPRDVARVFLRAAEICGLGSSEAGATIRSALEGAMRQLPARRFTDMGNAKRLVDAHGEFLRFVTGERGKEAIGWMIWAGTHWSIGRAPMWLVGMIAEELHDQAKRDGDKDLRKHARELESAKRIAACVQLASHHPEIQLDASRLDADPIALATPSGVVDLRTGALRPPDPRDLCTKLTRVEYDPHASAPRFEQFMVEVFPDEEVREHVRRWAGYCATGLSKEQKIHLWHGEGSNGKSLMLRVLSWALGSYAQTAAPELLLEKVGTAHATERAELRGARLVHTAETGESRRWDMSTMKQLTGSDPIRGRFMRQDFFELLPTWSIVVATNHRPRIVGYDHADWRRILVIPFSEKFDPGDPNLLDELLEESAGILRWVVEGARDYLRDGLKIPEKVTSEVARYREEQDVIGAFLSEHTVEDPEGFVVRSEIWRRYQQWLTETREYAHGRQAFFRLVGDRLGDIGRRSDGARGWPGRSLVTIARGVRRVT